MFKKILSFLGYQGPNILLIFILFVLYLQGYTTKTKFFVLIIGWQMASHFINIVLKNTLQLPRPDSILPELEKIKPTALNYLFVHDNYGMPSGHAQAVVSMFCFILLFFQQSLLSIVAFFQVVITLWERHTSNRHSFIQLLAGGGIGLLLGGSFYLLFHHLFYSENEMETEL